MPDALPTPARTGDAAKAWLDRNGALLRLRLDRPKANLIDAEMIASLQGTLDRNLGQTQLRGVLLDASGPHFSFGASVEEHLPERCAEMLHSLHGLLLSLLAFPAPVLVAARGQCLGGGLEVALACGPIFAAPNSQFGQPEMKLGVFAPAASCLLPYRMNQVAAEDLLLTGRSIGAEEARTCGLVHAVSDDPEAAALAYFDTQLAGKSAASLRCALVAARAPLLDDLRRRFDEVERLYLDRLMTTYDANEGLAAFLAKRQPVWENR